MNRTVQIGALLEDGSRALSRRQTVRLISEWAGEGRPAAVVRMGEGEGRLLAADPADDRSMRIAIKKLRRETGLTFSPKEALKVKALMMNALDEADVLGIGPASKFQDDHRAWTDLIVEVYADRVKRGRPPTYLAPCLLHNDLYTAMHELLAGQPGLSVISCRHLQPRLEADYGATDVVVYQTPSQYVMRDVDDDYEARLHDTAIWPDFYRGLKSAIRVRDRGEIFLVGAGMFGKDLCIHVRELGGIALDMGSTLDKMVNKITRGPKRPAFRPLPETPKVV